MTRSAGVPSGCPFTVDDLGAMSEDGRRYELIDGMIFANPTPGLRHQPALVKLLVALDRVCPDGMEVLLGPIAVRPSNDTELRPDGLV